MHGMKENVTHVGNQIINRERTQGTQRIEMEESRVFWVDLYSRGFLFAFSAFFRGYKLFRSYFEMLCKQDRISKVSY